MKTTTATTATKAATATPTVSNCNDNKKTTIDKRETKFGSQKKKKKV